MKKTILLSFFIALSSFVFAGGFGKMIPPFAKPELHLGMMKKSKYASDKDGRALSFGYYEFNSARLNNYLDTVASVNSSFDANYMAIGIDDIKNNSKHWDMIGSVQWLLPQKISAGPSDSLQLRLSGWHYTMSILGWDFIPGDMVTLALGTQISYGNFKMRREIQGQKTKYTNPFIAPGGRAEFRLTFGNFMIGARATYRYDITHGLWKRKDNLMPVLPEYKNNGLAYFGYIGLIF
jgi:hypothetical protein